MKNSIYQTAKLKWQYAVDLLEQHGIKPLDNRPTFSGRKIIVIHSEQLPNTICFAHIATPEQIKAIVELQVRIAQTA